MDKNFVKIINGTSVYYIDINKIEGFCIDYKKQWVEIYLNGRLVGFYTENSKTLDSIDKILKGEI